MTLAGQIKQQALKAGFDIVGITDASPIEPPQQKRLSEWLKAGFAGRMNYMHINLDKRIDPAKLLPNARSVICAGLNYKPEAKKIEAEGKTQMGKVAGFAQYEDYHFFIKSGLRKLIEFIRSVTKEDFGFKICVDSAPVAERALAARASLGFIGKNHMLINPRFGPQILIGEIITTLKLQSDTPAEENCSGCNKCIKACPTGALRSDGQFDANRCISYLTIEYKGQVPAELAEKIGDRLFGCDECVLACPYAKKAPACSNKKFRWYGDRASLDLEDVINLTGELFEQNFADSTISRSGLDILKRNARICLANSAVKSPDNKSLS